MCKATWRETSSGGFCLFNHRDSGHQLRSGKTIEVFVPRNVVDRNPLPVSVVLAVVSPIVELRCVKLTGFREAPFVVVAVENKLGANEREYPSLADQPARGFLDDNDGITAKAGHRPVFYTDRLLV